MSTEQFVSACRGGDEVQARALLEGDAGLRNQQGSEDGGTGLMAALDRNHHRLARWLVSLPGLHTNIRDEDNWTGLHWAACRDTPLDIVVQLAKLSSMQTLNRRNSMGNTALDKAVQFKKTSTALYLAWLGAECQKKYDKHREASLETWVEKSCQQDAQYWAVAANDISALQTLSERPDVTLDRTRLLELAVLFGHHEVTNFLLAEPEKPDVQEETPDPTPKQNVEEGMLEKQKGDIEKIREKERSWLKKQSTTRIKKCINLNG